MYTYLLDHHAANLSRNIASAADIPAAMALYHVPKFPEHRPFSEANSRRSEMTCALFRLPSRRSGEAYIESTRPSFSFVLSHTIVEDRSREIVWGWAVSSEYS